MGDLKIGVCEAEVTPEMLHAGLECWSHFSCVSPGPHEIEWIIRSALAHQPVALVSDAERALIRERDDARAELAKAAADIDMLYTSWTASVNENEALRAERDAYERQLTVTENRVFELKAELMAARDKLAKNAATIATLLTHADSTHDVIANAIRDRRR